MWSYSLSRILNSDFQLAHCKLAAQLQDPNTTVANWLRGRRGGGGGGRGETLMDSLGRLAKKSTEGTQVSVGRPKMKFLSLKWTLFHNGNKDRKMLKSSVAFYIFRIIITHIKVAFMYASDRQEIITNKIIMLILQGENQVSGYNFVDLFMYIKSSCCQKCCPSSPNYKFHRFRFDTML